MKSFSELSKVESATPHDGSFLIRWRGRQEGPFSPETIDAKLEANQIGLLHEIYYNGEWVIIRDYVTRKEAILQAELQAKEEQERHERDEAEKLARELEERQRAELLAEERRKNDLLQASLSQQQQHSRPSTIQPAVLKPHRAGTILALGLIGLLVCGPLCLAAWLMGDSDIREMEAGLMEASGRSTTGTGRALGIIGSIIWIIGIVCLIIF